MCAAATIMSLAAMVASILYFVLDRDLTTAAGFAGIGATCLAQRNLTASNAWRAAYVGAASIVAAVVVPDLDLERLRREGN